MRHVNMAAVVLCLFLLSCVTLAPESEPAPEAALRISGSGTALPVVQKLADAYSRERPTARFEFDAGTNSGGAVRGVIEGTLDIAVVNRALVDVEGREPIEYHAFARDAVVFVVKLPNRVEGLSSAQVRDIFGGSVTDWQQVGGMAGPIVALDRDEDESARKLVLLPLMAGRAVQARTSVLTSARDMIRALESTPNSLGYSSLGMMQILRPKDLRVLTLDGVTPTGETLASGAYRWGLTLGLVCRRDGLASATRFAEFALGPGGRGVLQESGYAAAP